MGLNRISEGEITQDRISLFCKNLIYITNLLSLGLCRNKIGDNGIGELCNNFSCIKKLQNLFITGKYINI